MKCFYHNDLDGRAAGFCVHAWVGIKSTPENNFNNIQFIEINYNKPFPFDSIAKDEQVWIVDYSISPDEMLRLLDITKDVTWIDHHKTAIEKYTDFPFPIKGLRRDGEAGCVLTWKYIHWYSDRVEPEPEALWPQLEKERSISIPVPRVIELVGDWDVWKFQYGDNTRAFQAGSGIEDTGPSSRFWWDCIISDKTEQTINAGKIALRYRSQWAKDFMQSWSFPVDFEGYRCIAANLGSCNSEYFKDVQGEYDIMMPFIFDGKKWTVSLYSTSVDVSHIAKKYGGGGHKGASGFQCATLPFINKPKGE